MLAYNWVICVLLTSSILSSILVYASQNPYWTAYRNVATNEKSRYMFKVGLPYNITDWLNAAARFRMDDTHVLFERKIYACLLYTSRCV